MKKNPMRLVGVFAGLVAAFAFATSGHAASILGISISLEQLINGPAVEVGDKQFSNFDYSPRADAPQAQNVEVTGVYDSQLDAFGLQFSGNFSAGFLEPKLLDAGLSFEVEALDPNWVISDVHLIGTAHVAGTGSAGITEVISGPGVPNNTPALRVLDQRLNGVAGPNNQVSDDIYFPTELGITGFRKIRVTKDIRLRAGDDMFDTAELTTFRQVFTQLPVVPEPATTSLLLLGLAAAGYGRRRAGV